MAATLQSYHLVILLEDDVLLGVVEEEREIGVGGRDATRFGHSRISAGVVHNALHGGVVGWIQVLSQWEATLPCALKSVVALRGHNPRRPADTPEVNVHVPSLAQKRGGTGSLH